MKNNSSAFNSNEYDNKVNTVLPYYSEYNKQIYDLISALELESIKWLDTGCGTGNLISGIKEQYPDAVFVLCDPSENMLSAAKRKLAGINKIQFRNISSQQLDYKDDFNIVTSVQSHHYLSKEQRKLAVKNCYTALKDGGIYITFENIALSKGFGEEIGMKRWKNYLINHGKTDEEAQKHISRRGTEVLPITIKEHIELLQEVGFKSADLLWMSYMQAGFFAIK